MLTNNTLYMFNNTQKQLPISIFSEKKTGAINDAPLIVTHKYI